MSIEEKAYWEEKARKVKEEHRKKYPDYKYNPTRCRKTKQHAVCEQSADDLKTPRKQRRRKDQSTLGIMQDVSDSRKVAAARKAARSKRAAKASNTNIASHSQSQNDISYAHALDHHHRAEIGPVAPLREIKLPTVSNFMRAAATQRASESPVLPLSPQGFQDPPFLSRRPPPRAATQFSATSSMNKRSQLEHDFAVERGAPAELGAPVPASAMENIPSNMEAPLYYEMQGNVYDRDPVLSWPAWQEAPVQQAIEPSYLWPVERVQWQFPAFGTNEDSWYTMSATEVAPPGSYAASYEMEQWERGYPSYP
ncbi:hypothetical protein C8Q73DRAFT_794206 [Cubamyces lactineus]|nr:hypothetical protein C8Q73DRAFT_794206 [Cubamyces lactineus]